MHTFNGKEYETLEQVQDALNEAKRAEVDRLRQRLKGKLVKIQGEIQDVTEFKAGLSASVYVDAIDGGSLFDIWIKDLEIVE